MKQLLDLPIFREPLFPGEEECISMDDNWLFHYTTADGFFHIIKSLKLKTSRLGKLNDLNEIHYNAYSQLYNIDEMAKLKEYIENRCSITCFSHHSLYLYRKEGYKIIPGCCNPSMWAHYAGNISGACLILDREELLKENRELFGKNVEIQEVTYKTEFNPYQTQETAEAFLRENRNNLFFLKDEAWENESEVRLLLTDISPTGQEPMVSIAKSLKGIVFSHKFWENSKDSFIHELLQPNSFLSSMCPLYWFRLTQSQVAYDIGPFDFEEGLYKLIDKNSAEVLNAQSYLKSLRERYKMDI